MLLQSWGGKVRVFPAVPTNWKNIEFKNWLAEGAFEVSAKLRDGKVERLEIKSLAGTPLILNAQLKKPQASINKKAVKLTEVGSNVFNANLAKGETLIIVCTL